MREAPRKRKQIDCAPRRSGHIGPGGSPIVGSKRVALAVAPAVIHGIGFAGRIAHNGPEGSANSCATQGSEAGVVSDNGTGAGTDEATGDASLVHVGIGGGTPAEGDEGEGGEKYEEKFARIHHFRNSLRLSPED